jgi:hypothetical protein
MSWQNGPADNTYLETPFACNGNRLIISKFEHLSAISEASSSLVDTYGLHAGAVHLAQRSHSGVALRQTARHLDIPYTRSTLRTDPTPTDTSATL